MSDLPAPDPETAARLRAAGIDPATLSSLATTPAESARDAVAAAVATPAPVSVQDLMAAATATAPAGIGEASREFTTVRVAESVVLKVDGQAYRCRDAMPADPIVDLMEARDAGMTGRMLGLVRRVLWSALIDEDLERYRYRTNGTDLRPYVIDPETGIARSHQEITEATIRENAGPGPDPEDNPEGAEAHEATIAAQVAAAVAGIEDVPPIDPAGMMEHALWLAGVYLRRPTQGPAPSGAGS